MKVDIMRTAINKDKLEEAIEQFKSVQGMNPILLMNKATISEIFEADWLVALCDCHGLKHSNCEVYLCDRLMFGEIELR